MYYTKTSIIHIYLSFCLLKMKMVVVVVIVIVESTGFLAVDAIFFISQYILIDRKTLFCILKEKK